MQNSVGFPPGEAVIGQANSLGAAVEVGTGIFLSSVLIAIVLLYGFTKDRWRWRKIGVWLLLLILVPIAGSAAVATLAHYWDELFPTRLGRQTQYAGLKLGMSPQEVIYIKGYPPVVLEKDNSDSAWARLGLRVVETKDLAQGKKVTDLQALVLQAVQFETRCCI